MYIISGRGRKNGVARATEATASLAPLRIINMRFIDLLFCQITTFIKVHVVSVFGLQTL